MKIFNMYLLLWIKKQKLNAAGTAPIILRITINGVRFQFSTGLRIKPQNWNDKTKRHKTNKILNAELDSIIIEIKQIAASLRLQNNLSIETIKNYLKPPPKEKTVLDILTEYKKRCTDKETNYTNDRYFKNLVNFCEAKNIKTVKDFNSSFYLDLSDHLKGINIKSGEYIKGHFKYLRAALLNAKINETALNTAVIPILKKVNIKFTLTKKEVKQVKNYTPECSKMQKVKDLFLFQVCTGISYVDIYNVKVNDVKKHKNLTILESQRQKTKTNFTTILNTRAIEILERYNYVLPPISNQKYNLYLKELADKAGINKPITSHCARRTFGQLMLNKGISIEGVSYMLGHSDIKTTQAHYAKPGSKLVLNELKLLKKTA